nr:endonuclease/exonuclease/phosphatase family protein [Bernardetiaceae bacterium]
MRVFLSHSLRFLNVILAIFTLLCYACVWVPPSAWWPAGFLALLIPALLIAHGLLAVFWSLRRRWRASLYSWGALAIGYRFVLASFGFHWPAPEPPGQGFSVLSYNTHLFNVYQSSTPHNDFNRRHIQWVVDDTADIKCFQEFYNLDTSVVFNSVDRIKAQGRYQVYFDKASNNDFDGYMGLAIFSKFPIVHTGCVEGEVFWPYGAIYADLKIGRDTLRVYNVHLESMSIDENAIVAAPESRARLERTARRLRQQLRRGMVERSEEVALLADHLARCPYPILVCGDLNDPPYSYPYFRLRDQLTNTFEAVGSGPGFTFNGKLFFLRIDHQF